MEVRPGEVLTNSLGHDERRIGRKLVYCIACKAKKPPGGWSKPCPKGGAG